METNTVQAAPASQPSEIGAGDRRLRFGDHRFSDIVSAHHQQFLGFAYRNRLCSRAHRHDRMREGRKSGKGLSIAGVVMNVIAFAVVLAYAKACTVRLSMMPSPAPRWRRSRQTSSLQLPPLLPMTRQRAASRGSGQFHNVEERPRAHGGRRGHRASELMEADHAGERDLSEQRQQPGVVQSL